MIFLDESAVNARWAILPLGLLQWLMMSSLDYVDRSNIRLKLKKWIAVAIAASATGGIVLLQIQIYQFIAPISSVGKDNYFFSIILAELLVSICIGFRIAVLKRRREKA